MIITAIITVIAAYLLGSINFAVVFSTAFMKRDVRELGSGNAGATNVLRTAGKLPGLLTFLCDALKGYVACYLGKTIFEYISHFETGEWTAPIYGAYICGLVCMLGHVFPIFYQFKGGKGVATSVGIFAVCCPIAIALGLLTFAVVLALSKMVSLSSLTATVVVVVLSLFFYDTTASIIPQAILCISMGIIVVAKHIDNIKRLLSGTENKIGSRR